MEQSVLRRKGNRLRHALCFCFEAKLYWLVSSAFAVELGPLVFCWYSSNPLTSLTEAMQRKGHIWSCICPGAIVEDNDQPFRDSCSMPCMKSHPPGDLLGFLFSPRLKLVLRCLYSCTCILFHFGCQDAGTQIGRQVGRQDRIRIF